MSFIHASAVGQIIGRKRSMGYCQSCRDTPGWISAEQGASSSLVCDIKDVADRHMFSTAGEGNKPHNGKSGDAAQPVCTGYND